MVNLNQKIEKRKEYLCIILIGLLLCCGNEHDGKDTIKNNQKKRKNIRRSRRRNKSLKKENTKRKKVVEKVKVGNKEGYSLIDSPPGAPDYETIRNGLNLKVHFYYLLGAGFRQRLIICVYTDPFRL